MVYILYSNKSDFEKMTRVIKDINSKPYKYIDKEANIKSGCYSNGYYDHLDNDATFEETCEYIERIYNKNGKPSSITGRKSIQVIGDKKHRMYLFERNPYCEYNNVYSGRFLDK